MRWREKSGPPISVHFKEKWSALLSLQLWWVSQVDSNDIGLPLFFSPSFSPLIKYLGRLSETWPVIKRSSPSTWRPCWWLLLGAFDFLYQTCSFFLRGFNCDDVRVSSWMAEEITRIDSIANLATREKPHSLVRQIWNEWKKGKECNVKILR